MGPEFEPIVTVSQTVPWAQVTSSDVVDGAQTNPTVIDVEVTSTRRWPKCRARLAMRGSVLDHAARLRPPVPATMWMTPWIGSNRS